MLQEAKTKDLAKSRKKRQQRIETKMRNKISMTYYVTASKKVNMVKQLSQNSLLYTRFIKNPKSKTPIPISKPMV